MGFTLARTEGGLLASAEPHVVVRVRRDPATLIHFAPVLVQLVDLARELGAEPVAVELPGRPAVSSGARVAPTALAS